MAIVMERQFGGITVCVDDRDIAKTPEEKRRVDEEIVNVLYNNILADPVVVEQLRKYNLAHYGCGD